MKASPFPTAKDPALLFGCGRFRMEENLIEHCADEILRIGRHPLLVCDANTQLVAGDAVAAALRAAGADARVMRHDGFCCREDALAMAESGTLEGIDVVLGCGGGVILDTSKCLAHLAGAPLVTIPTSSAQCCAYTPIAACYTHDGRYVSTSHFPREIALALLDLTILSRQPPRLLAAGALDAMAKKIEIEFWLRLDAMAQAMQGDGDAAGGIASAISDYIYEVLDSKADTALADLANDKPTQAIRDVVFASIVGAGIVSGISGGSRQVAFAHRLYYGLRTLHPAEAARFTHGELVAIGLVMQLAYYGRAGEARAMAARLRGWRLPASIRDLGLPDDPGEADAIFEYLCGTKTMKAAIAVDTDAPARLREALSAIMGPNAF